MIICLSIDLSVKITLFSEFKVQFCFFFYSPLLPSFLPSISNLVGPKLKSNSIRKSHYLQLKNISWITISSLYSTPWSKLPLSLTWTSNWSFASVFFYIVKYLRNYVWLYTFYYIKSKRILTHIVNHKHMELV